MDSFSENTINEVKAIALANKRFSHLGEAITKVLDAAFGNEQLTASLVKVLRERKRGANDVAEVVNAAEVLEQENAFLNGLTNAIKDVILANVYFEQLGMQLVHDLGGKYDAELSAPTQPSPTLSTNITPGSNSTHSGKPHGLNHTDPSITSPQTLLHYSRA